MKHNSETILDDTEEEIIVSYQYERTDETNSHKGIWDTEITSVLKDGKEILKSLTEDQKQFIISKLKYE